MPHRSRRRLRYTAPKRMTRQGECRARNRRGRGVVSSRHLLPFQASAKEAAHAAGAVFSARGAGRCGGARYAIQRDPRVNVGSVADQHAPDYAASDRRGPAAPPGIDSGPLTGAQ